MKILHVSQVTAGGGLTEYLRTLLTLQARDPLVKPALACPPSGPLYDVALQTGIEIYPWTAVRDVSPAGLVREVRSLSSLVDEARPDLIHLHSSKAGLAGRLAVRGRLPTVFQPHAWSFHAFEKGIRQQVARAWETAASRWHTILLTGSIGELMTGISAGAVRRPWAVVNNFVDADYFRPPTIEERSLARERFGFTEDELVLTCVGRFCKQKGQDILLEAWTAADFGARSPTLLLVGDSSTQQFIDLGNYRRADIRLTGWSTDVRAVYWASDVLLQPSRWETLSLSLLEGMSTGIPALTSDIPSMAGVIGSGPDAAGWLFELSTESMRQAIERIVQLDTNTRRAFGNVAHSRAQFFQAEDSVNQIASVYRSILDP